MYDGSVRFTGVWLLHQLKIYFSYCMWRPAGLLLEVHTKMIQGHSHQASSNVMLAGQLSPVLHAPLLPGFIVVLQLLGSDSM